MPFSRELGVRNKILITITCLAGYLCFSQVEESETTEQEMPSSVSLKVKDTLLAFEAADWKYQFSARRLKLMADPLTPAKATFLSAILPGLGQIYLGKYLWTPIIWAGLGTSLYFYINNQNEYNRFRNIYKRRLVGYTDDEYALLIPDDEQILQGMEFYQENRDISAIFVALTYILNVIHANVAAHMLQFNIDENLTFTPNLHVDALQTGISFSIDF